MSHARTLTYPTARLEDLSEDARILFRASTNGNGRLDRDPFDPAARRKHVSHEEGRAYQPDARVIDAARELEAAGVASLDRNYVTLHRTLLHPLYTVAHGRGPFFAQVRLVPRGEEPMPDVYRAPLLATLTGATFDRRDSRAGATWTTWTLQTRHQTATDFEHDASKVATFEILNPVYEAVYGGGYQTWIGTLTDARMYPFGVDPTDAGDADTSPGICEGEEGEEGPHPWAPFQPPQREDVAALVPGVVIVTLYPLVAYNVAGENPAAEED